MTLQTTSHHQLGDAHASASAPSAPVPTLTPDQARRRASSVAAALGLAQALAIIGMWLATGRSRDFWTSPAAAWPLVSMLAGPVYLVLAWPIRRGVVASVWIGMVASLAQTLVFGGLALLSIIAALRAGAPGQMTLGVLLFGSVASMHAFLLRWLWWGRRA